MTTARDVPPTAREWVAASENFERSEKTRCGQGRKNPEILRSCKISGFLSTRASPSFLTGTRYLTPGSISGAQKTGRQAPGSISGAQKTGRQALGLVGGTEKVEDDLDWVEGLDGNLDEEGVPVAHGAVPEARKLESLELAALIALGADESGFLIDIVREIELLAAVVAQAADEVAGRWIRLSRG